MVRNKRSVWADGRSVNLIDQTKLPFQEVIFKSNSYVETCSAIQNMLTRGAGSIGATAGFAMMQAAFEAPEMNKEKFLKKAKKEIESTRPTAQDLFAAVERVYQKAILSVDEAEKEAHKIADETAEAGERIGEYGNELIRDGGRILTHCNAGPLALVEHGSALAPIIKAHQSGKKIFVYVDETRPRNQGAKLTAWELQNAGIPHAVIADNAAGYFMYEGKLDLVITGADRIAANGDTANKIGTLEKAVLAKEFNIPFYIAAPMSTFDEHTKTGKAVRVENRDQDEVLYIFGEDKDGVIRKVRIASRGSTALNPAFDITPVKYISGFITPRGIIQASEL